MQINNSLEEYKDISTSRARLMSLVMSTALFLNTRTWSFPKLELQRKQKNSLLTTFLGFSSLRGHGINIPLKKREKILGCHFSCITARYWLIMTITDRLLAYSSKQEHKCWLCLADVHGRNECMANKSKPHRTSAGRLMFLWY